MANPKLTIVRNGPKPIYEQISNHLKERIASGEFAPGQKLPGIKVLAKSLGVNHITLRQALRELEAEKIVMTESARGTFVLGDKPTQLQVALVLPNLNESSSSISAGVQEQLHLSESTVDILHYDESPRREAEQLRRLVAEGYDGAIVFPSLDPLSLKPLLQMLLDGFPLVFIDRAPAQLPCWSVWADNFRGGYLAAEHLISRGCSRISCEFSALPGVIERYEGFLRAMGDHGLPVDYNLIRRFERNDDEVEEIVAKWMSLPNPPDGIAFGNDYQALRGIRQILLEGRRVPEDVRVIGFDDISVSTYSKPSLTTVRQDHSAIGRQATSMLQELVMLPRDKRFEDRHVRVPVSLVVRESA